MSVGLLVLPYSLGLADSGSGAAMVGARGSSLQIRARPFLDADVNDGDWARPADIRQRDLDKGTKRAEDPPFTRWNHHGLPLSG